jgi:hypothetical protein
MSPGAVAAGLRIPGRVPRPAGALGEAARSSIGPGSLPLRPCAGAGQEGHSAAERRHGLRAAVGGAVGCDPG